MGATLNGQDIISARLTIPWRGAWIADVDVDPEVIATLPTSGPATIVVGTPPDPTSTLLGTIDPRFSGAFVATGKVRVIGGAGGWDKPVPSQHFQSPGGALTSTQILQATAALVHELVTDLQPTPWGKDYARSAGPASRVFGDGDWWVDLATPVTFVGPRKPAIADPSLLLLEWDPGKQIAEVSCDVPVVPGTVLVDPRIGGAGQITVRDVIQTFASAGARATCYCASSPATQLASLLRAVARELGGTWALKHRRYRYVMPGPGTKTMTLQAVARDTQGSAAPAPDLVPLVEWAGMAGLSALLPPSLEVIVALVDGDPKQPFVVAYSTAALPLQLTADAQVSVHVGPSAATVDLAGGAFPLVVGPWATGLAAALAAMASTLGGASDPAVTSAASALTTALGSLPPPATTKTTAT